MRLLIDECVDERLRHEFAGHDCQTTRFAGLSGLKNGRLLEAAEAAGFQVLITVDQNIPHQQNLTNRELAILILKVPTNRLYDLRRAVKSALQKLETIQKGELAVISVSGG